MAQKRMFSMKIVDSDAFLDMPLSTQCLYFHLNMRADDDGFVGNTKKIMRMIGASEDDLKILLAKKFLLVFENNVIVIKHWWIHNTLTKDRYHETSYTDEKHLLKIKENRSYTMLTNGNKMLTTCIQNVNADLDLDIDIDLNKDEGEEKEEPPSPPPLMSLPQENYSKQVFEKFKNANLPCSNGDFFTFQSRDFRNALYKLKGHKSQEVLQAIDNYIFELRNPESYPLKEMSFDNFVDSKTFSNCLPANYRHGNFKSFKKQCEQVQQATEERHFYEICTKCGQNTMEWSNKKQRYVCYACGCELTFEEVDYARHPEQLSN